MLPVRPERAGLGTASFYSFLLPKSPEACPVRTKKVSSMDACAFGTNI